jgi:acetyl-CoA/propionyl-CoA carboxylase biotin carboxyl carrier protein
MFDTVLVANRGEIALRVVRTLRALGIGSVAVHSDADAGAPHVAAADVAVRLGPAPAARSYLSVPAILAAARATGARAVHPGYGFLAENAAFAAACADAGLVFVGPPPSAIAAMGDKIRARRTAVAAGVPVVPGADGTGLSDDELARAAADLGYPVLLKPSAGGGGKGMREVHAPAQLADALAGARREALGAFGDATLLVERLVAAPRHVEIQVLADAHGAVLHLGERECSLQRRHQKVVEEAPSPLLTPARRARMGAAAVAVARAVGYRGVGTVEFLLGADRPDEFFFLEMNTRLQVEHPVTELVTGLDLVELQLRVAAGEPLPIAQDEVVLRGHAVEARVYAEDPRTGFLPTGGRVLALREPSGPGVRVDSGIAAGVLVGADYDPLLAKVVAHGADRAEALARLDAALARTAVLGLDTNVAFLRALLADADVRAGRLDTGLVGRRLAELTGADPTGADLPPDVLGAATGAWLLAREPRGPVVDPFDVPGGWRLGEPAWTTRRLAVAGHAPLEVRCRGRAAAAELVIDAGPPVRTCTAADPDGTVVHTHDGVTRRYVVAVDGHGVTWVSRGGRTWAVHDRAAEGAAAEAVAGAAGPVRSPMPGRVSVVAVVEGQRVAAGQQLVVVEAMKMEHVLTAPVDGVVRALHTRPGAAVARDAVLLTLEP